MLHKGIVNEIILELILHLQSKEYLKDFILAGGTGLAVQIGHRKSDDIDLFNLAGFDHERVLENLESDFGFQLDYIERNTLKGSINGIKVDIITHPYKYIHEPLNIENICIASIMDICAMKLNAIANDGTRVKDFIDMYFLLGMYDLSDILNFYTNKYKLRNPMHALKSLTYFKEVDTAQWPLMIKEKELSWKEVKTRIEAKFKTFHSSLPGNKGDYR